MQTTVATLISLIAAVSASPLQARAAVATVGFANHQTGSSKNLEIPLDNSLVDLATKLRGSNLDVNGKIDASSMALNGGFADIPSCKLIMKNGNGIGPLDTKKSFIALASSPYTMDLIGAKIQCTKSTVVQARACAGGEAKVGFTNDQLGATFNHDICMDGNPVAVSGILSGSPIDKDGKLGVTSISLNGGLDKAPSCTLSLASGVGFTPLTDRKTFVKLTNDVSKPVDLRQATITCKKQ